MSDDAIEDMRKRLDDMQRRLDDHLARLKRNVDKQSELIRDYEQREGPWPFLVGIGLGLTILLVGAYLVKHPIVIDPVTMWGADHRVVIYTWVGSDGHVNHQTHGKYPHFRVHSPGMNDCDECVISRFETEPDWKPMRPAKREEHTPTAEELETEQP